MIAIIILAAGNSSRLGQPKQLLEYQGKSLLKNSANQALAINDAIVIVVSGAENTSLEKELQNTKIILCHNNDWQLGMSSSIRTGLKKALEVQPQISACIISVCDQPFISENIFKTLVLKHKSSDKIIASYYAETAGTPVLFPKKYFPELLNLTGNEGAKKLLNATKELFLVNFEKGEIDIDTMEDYQKLIT
ncbi:nucleotidyltransferase family protein [uncultured Flavobacterium sp.]|uniref:nucleotidyltransferase family protein n=1 Tax=uncultured Flavobacterium sp. TaxID=165435 RepID=UPI0025CDCA24|nr:nucleotidyltransferase family protein [uncultured Flavobacterium sp.]